MSRRLRSPLHGASRRDLRVLRDTVTVAKRWAATLGTEAQRARPTPLSELCWLPPENAAHWRLQEASDRAERRALRHLDADTRREIRLRDVELFEQTYHPERVKARQLDAALAELADLRGRVEQLEARRA